MKRSAALILILVFSLTACIPGFPSLGQPSEASVVNSQATDLVLAATLVVETLNALPTPTLEPTTDTPEPTSTFTETATETATEPPTETLVTGTPATATFTGTPPTATSTVTGTPPTPTLSETPSPTETLYARFYGTLPPAIPYGKVKLVNKSKTEVYVSLHCTTVDGYTTIIEYPVEGSMKVSAPAGSYTYVAWVGGKKFTGWFNLHKGKEKQITFEKNQVTVE